MCFLDQEGGLLTQPALSRSIQELERRTGIRLFDRIKGRVEPTDLGRVFIAHARKLLGRAEALDREVATMRGSGTGSLVIGSGTFPTAMFMAGALGAFLRKNPQVGIRLVNDNWVALVTALRRRELDFVVAAPPSAAESTGLAIHRLSLRQGYFLVRPGHPLLTKHTLSLPDIAACPIVCTGRLPEMMRHIAGGSDHVLMSSLSANAKAIAAGELVVLPFIDARICVAFAILRLEARTLPPIADELVREVIAADRSGLDAERELAARLLEPASARSPAARPPKRRRSAAVAAVR